MTMKKGMKINTVAWAAAAVVLAVAVPVNLIFSKLDKSIDVTPFGAYSLSESAEQALSSLEKPVDITVLYELDRFYDDSEPGEEAYMIADMYVTTLRQMAKFDKINLKEINIEKNPGFVTEKDPENLMNLAAGDLLLECNGKMRDISLRSLFTTNAETGSVEFYGENSILGAIGYLESGITPTVYFTEGHGEKSNDKCESLVHILEGQNYDVKTLNIGLEKKIPEDAVTLVMAAPARDLTAEEKDIIIDYTRDGGNLTMLLAPQAVKGNFTNIDAVLATYELAMDYNRVFETSSERYAGDDKYAVLCQYVDTDFNKPIIQAQGSSTLYMPETRSFYSLADDEEKSTVTQERLVQTFLNEELNAAQQCTSLSDVYGGNRTDRNGPGGVLYLAAKAEDSARNGSKLFVSGSFEFIEDESILEIMDKTGTASLAPYLFLSTISWMDKVNSDSLFPTRVSATDYITIPDRKTGNIILVLMIALPVLIAGSGVIVWARRRNA